MILLYLESFGHPRRFARIARRIGKQKPIVAVKSGRTSAGARAASSHTGALASVEVAVSALFRQAGRDPGGHPRADVRGGLAAGQPAAPDGAPGGGAHQRRRARASWPPMPWRRRACEVPEFSDELQERAAGALSPEAAVAQPGRHDRLGGPRPVPGVPGGTARQRRDRLRHRDLHPDLAGRPADRSKQVDPPRSRPTAPSGKTMLTVFMEADADERPDRAREGPRVPVLHLPRAGGPGPGAGGPVRRVAGASRRARSSSSTTSTSRPPRTSSGRRCARLGPDGGWLEPDEAEAVLGAFGIRSGRVATWPPPARRRSPPPPRSGARSCSR